MPKGRSVGNEVDSRVFGVSVFLAPRNDGELR